MLPNSPDVELVALGKDGIIEGARSGLIFADMSTISPLVSQKVGKALEAKGVRMLDAPVSGGEKGAIDGALSIMVGGDQAVFDAVLPIFQAMGKTITLLGPLGFGGFTKLANQIIVAVNLTALGEALTLARKAGLDRELTLKALAGGLAGSRCLDQKAPNYVAGTYNPGFKIDLHFKDLGTHHGVGPGPRGSSSRDGGGPGAVQRPQGQGARRSRPLRGDHLAGRPRGPLCVRATVDRPGLDSHGRSSKVQVRRIRKGDLSRPAMFSSRPSPISSSASSARDRGRRSAARSTSIIAGSWSPGAASWPRRTVAGSSGWRSPSPGARWG